MIRYKLFSYVILEIFLYLCIRNKKTIINYEIMETIIKTFGRTELATHYFPTMNPDAAWHKLRSWLKINPRLAHFYNSRRRSFSPAEVALIYSELGEP